MTAMTPIPEGTVVFVGKTDENDQHSPLEAHRVQPTADGDAEWVPIFQSAYTDEPDEYVLAVANFLEVARIYAQFHNLEVQNETGFDQ